MTTIKSTNLDFANIKASLKNYLKQKEEFRDYDFQGSAINNLLDVLAWNTHFNGLTANFSLNEAYLNTAQLRSSVVSLAEGIGYVPRSRTTAQATVRMSLNLLAEPNQPASFEIPSGFRFNGIKLNDTSRVFQTREILYATLETDGYYKIKDVYGNENITIYEGTEKTRIFIADDENENAIYVLPDESLDIDSMIVTVYPDTQDLTNGVTYKNLRDIDVLTEDTEFYLIKEAPNGYYEMTFGDNNTLGVAPIAGNKIEINYLSSNGVDGNNIQTFKSLEKFNINGNTYNYAVVTISESVGGQEKESIQNIKKNAPFQYGAQNRMVTSNDYSALILRNFGTIINDINTFGGEDALNPKYGYVYICISFIPTIENDSIAKQEKINEIRDYINNLSVISFRPDFISPTITYIETKTYFQFNPKFTTQTLSKIKSDVNTAIDTYFFNNTGKFNQSFRRSNMLTAIDAVSPAVLSSRSNIRMQQRIDLFYNKPQDYTLRFPGAIESPSDEYHVLESNVFGIDGRQCRIRNKLDSNKLEVYDINNKIVLYNNVGYYESTTGKVYIEKLYVSELLNNATQLHISVIPLNQSAISPTLEDILVHDSVNSFATARTVESE